MEEGTSLLICPTCDTRCEYDDGVCGNCGGSLAPAEASRKFVRPEGREIPAYEGSKPHVPNTKLRVAVVAALAVVAMLYLVVLPATKGPGDNPMTQTAEVLAGLQDRGALDSKSLATAVEQGRVNSECGWVYAFVIPTSAVPTQQSGGGIGGGVPQDPVTVITGYVQSTYKPDKLAVAEADKGKTVVVAVGWSCP